jgi:hypothetical protein
MGTAGRLTEPVIAFCATEHEEPALRVRVNFGVFSGRQATPAEIDTLARALHGHVASFTIVAEERHEFAGDVEAAIHQIVIEVEHAYAGYDVDELCDRIVALADRWASDCFADRHSDVAEF